MGGETLGRFEVGWIQILSSHMTAKDPRICMSVSIRSYLLQESGRVTNKRPTCDPCDKKLNPVHRKCNLISHDFLEHKVTLTSHEQDGIDAALPMRPEHRLGLPDEDLGFFTRIRRTIFSLNGFCMEEDCALRDE